MATSDELVVAPKRRAARTEESYGRSRLDHCGARRRRCHSGVEKPYWRRSPSPAPARCAAAGGATANRKIGGALLALPKPSCARMYGFQRPVAATPRRWLSTARLRELLARFDWTKWPSNIPRPVRGPAAAGYLGAGAGAQADFRSPRIPLAHAGSQPRFVSHSCTHCNNVATAFILL